MPPWRPLGEACSPRGRSDGRRFTGGRARPSLRVGASLSLTVLESPVVVVSKPLCAGEARWTQPGSGAPRTRGQRASVGATLSNPEIHLAGGHYSTSRNSRLKRCARRRQANPSCVLVRGSSKGLSTCPRWNHFSRNNRRAIEQRTVCERAGFPGITGLLCRHPRRCMSDDDGLFR